ncbi:ubiquinone anaerobic biosynthesis accessory factor UbiT [Shewanella gelidii]|uniref:Ubiquinone biosynthesis accessory factor UbiT n=1 Tax=Shewanella gelidii TaxID=1642821 RepID=A0A917JM99_9GAMM|nr:SCP2 sterol-binding domain-containing protein [Shewanella gelidii]MCL1097174.1 SCP2 sterol-binding domain-containing protein [Shewanella gelidii]GGI73060.1 SCP-2 sterol transfer family protein [Shewanella gelidii]
MANIYTTQIAKRLLDIAPKIAKTPIGVVPFNLKAKAVQQLLTLILAEQAKDDELAFLCDNWVGICIQDLGLEFEVTYQQQWHVRPLAKPAVTFTANSKELILIAAAKEDPDTLFFQRKLNIEGDTELGLEVKNLLLSIEFEAMPSPVRHGVNQLSLLIVKLQEQAEPQTV